MKLLRLTSNDVNGYFDATFDEEITVKPESKMALHSLSFEQIKRAITINGDNDEITVHYSATKSYTVRLSHNQYTPDNVDFLLSNIQKALNETLYLDDRNSHGDEWRVEKNQQNKIALTNDTNPTLSRFEKERAVNIAFTSGKYEATATSGQVASSNFMSRGCGYLRVKTTRVSSNGCIIGITNVNPSTIVGGSINVSNFKYGIVFDKTANEFRYILNGIVTGAPIPYVSENDVAEIAITGGLIKLNVYREAGVAVDTLYTTTYDNETEYYPVINITGADKVSVSYLQSAFQDKVSALTEDVFLNTDSLGVAPPRRLNTPSIQYIEFESAELAEYLGFDNARLPSKNTANLQYVADNLFLLNSYNDSFVVELFDIKIDSYDSQNRQRRNILAVVPSSEINESGVVYEPNNLIFINLNNQEMFIRNLRLRVLQRDLSPINLKGLAVMSLLIKDKDE